MTFSPVLAYYLTLYHQRTLIARSFGLSESLRGSPLADEIILAASPVSHLDETDRLAWALGLQEMIKANRREISGLVEWAKAGEDRGQEALEKGQQLMAEIEAANWYLELL